MVVEAIDVDVDVKGHEAVPAKNGRVLGLIDYYSSISESFTVFKFQVKNSTSMPTRNTHKIRMALYTERTLVSYLLYLAA